MIQSIVVDTGALYALADRSDRWHAPMRDFVADQRGVFVVPIVVLPEACYLLNAYLGAAAERQLLAACVRGELVVEPVEASDLQRALQLLETYAEANIGFVDAAVVAVAERLRIPRVLTTDRRHFALVRPRHCTALELLP